MKTKTVIAFAALIAFTAPALAAGNGKGNGNANAQSMAAALQGGGGGNNSPLKAQLGLTGNGGVASYVSGGGNGGWGNVGSTLTGGQVSSSNK